ncbi:MAG TPA: glycosyltransferase [Gemmatimonadaceae bacterium]
MAPTNSQLDVSIVIPTYARPEQLRSCLAALQSIPYRHDRLEVIVVDDGGPRPLEPIVAEFQDVLAIQLLTQHNGGPGKARNLGASVAGAKFLVFIDDDCVPSAAWLSALVGELKANPGCLAAGPVLNALTGNRYSTASQLIATFVAEHYASGRGKEQFFTTNNFALSAERFAELGGFDTSIPSATAEDKEFCDRWRERGYKMAWLPSAIVYHAHELTLRGFLRQHYNYGRGILSFRLRRRQRGAQDLLPEPFSFYGRLIFHPLRKPEYSSRGVSVALIMLSQIATVAGALRSAIGEMKHARERRISARKLAPHGSAAP